MVRSFGLFPVDIFNSDSIPNTDIIFFIYLYQRWIYPVDKKRISDGFEEAEIDGDVTVPNAIVDADNANAAASTSTAVVAQTSSVPSSNAPKGGKGRGGETKKQR